MSQVFDAYARYYDLLYRDKDYAGEAAYVAAHIQKYAPQAKRILELGCGTGAHAEHLARMGYTVYGVDLSETMLARAELRRSTLPAELATRMQFDLGDVRSMRTGNKYDVVVSLFHVMSYQTSDADLVASIETAYLHLPERGIFLFDFWFGPAVLAQKPELRIKRLEDDKIRVTRIAEPVVHAGENTVDVNYDVFIETKIENCIEEVREYHRMRYLFLSELQNLLQGAGFEVLEQCKWMGDESPDETSWSAFVVARK